MTAKGKGDFIQVMTTTSIKKDAEKVARMAVEAHLAACAQVVGPITSFYRWNGAIENSGEWLCILKTKKSLFKKLARQIKENHAYALPEILALPIIAGSKPYLSWMRDELKVKAAKSKKVRNAKGFFLPEIAGL